MAASPPNHPPSLLLTNLLTCLQLHPYVLVPAPICGLLTVDVPRSPTNKSHASVVY